MDGIWFGLGDSDYLVSKIGLLLVSWVTLPNFWGNVYQNCLPHAQVPSPGRRSFPNYTKIMVEQYLQMYSTGVFSAHPMYRMMLDQLIMYHNCSVVIL